MTTSDVVIKVTGVGRSTADGVVLVDGHKVAEVAFKLAPSNPFDPNSKSIPCDLFDVLLGEHWVGSGSNEFVRKTE